MQLTQKHLEYWGKNLRITAILLASRGDEPLAPAGEQVAPRLELPEILTGQNEPIKMPKLEVAFKYESHAPPLALAA